MPNRNYTFPEEERRHAPPGMTKEQLDFFTYQTEHAVRKGTSRGVKHYRNNALVGFMILLVGVGWNIREVKHATEVRTKVAAESRDAIVASGRIVAIDGCNRDYADRVKFRNLLLRLKIATKSNPNSSPEQKKRAVEFYDQELSNYPLIDCRRARNVITSNPDSLRAAPDPYYPGNPRAPREVRVSG